MSAYNIWQFNKLIFILILLCRIFFNIFVLKVLIYKVFRFLILNRYRSFISFDDKIIYTWLQCHRERNVSKINKLLI